MKAYSNYKDSGVSGIEKIPKDWISEKIKFVATCNDEVLSDSTADDEIINYVEIGDVDYVNGITNTTEYEFKEAPSRARRITRPNDIIISTVRTYLKAIAKITEPDLIVSTGFAVIRPRRIDEVFMSYALLAPTFIEEVMSRSFGVSYPAIKASSLMNIKICTPPLSEQQEIASFLDAKTKPIDDIIAKREKQIELLEEMKSAIISRTVTKGLNIEAKMKDSGIEWIGEIPEGWEMRKLKYILKSEKYNIKTGPFGTQLKGNDLREEGDVPVYNQRNVIDNQFHSPSVFVTLDKANELAGFHTKTNDVLITSRGTIGKAAILPNGAKEGILHPCLIALRINQDLVNLKYLLYYINGFEGFAINVFLESNATTIEVIYTDTLKNIFVTLPQLEEQKRIVSYLDSETSKIDTRIAKRRKQIELLQEYKQALITAAVTGKIDVREYIP